VQASDVSGQVYEQENFWSIPWVAVNWEKADETDPPPPWILVQNWNPMTKEEILNLSFKKPKALKYPLSSKVCA